MKILIESATELLSDGKVIALPTDTVYGVAARADKPFAIASIFELKKRPTTNPLVLFVRNKEEVSRFVTHIPPGGNELMDAFWPGPLTLVFDPLAIRIPGHPLIRELLEKTGPLFVTSANISGSPPLKTREAIEETFGPDFPILEGELPKIGIASTILSYHENAWKIDRKGPLTPEDFFPILNYLPILK